MFQQQKLFNDSNSSELQIQVFFDGACQPINPGGIACYSFIIKNEDNTIHRGYGLAAYDSTNNVAEYTALIKSLEWLLAKHYENVNILIRGDSLLVINQVKRRYEVYAPNIIPLYHKAIFLISKFQHIEFEWISRGQNKEADKLTCRAYEEHHT